MSELPRYILRDCTIFVDTHSKIGQASEITLPVPTEKVEELRNAGMIMPIEVKLGFEKMEAGFKLTAFDPQVIKLVGLKAGVEKAFMATGALVDEDGTVHPAVAYMRGFLKSHDPGSWKPGEVGESDHPISLRYYKLEVDGEELLEVDPFGISVGGVSQTGDIRGALLLS
ncbi:phage major tail tube protein [Breoghania sp. L-A4]|uniref:phage major tail tube protein n=1 Tax=Breoghania sp. L-A4 TaxID=2304600 RepID=UPI000E35E430|nr:phage major tail tube protein [Breoghania sp. L-A4]AXS39276.1 phage major tail tube protein [Breoghania sp. L-A4]